VAIFDVIAGCDPADPVIAASQGKWADSYLRFLDKDGARGARLGVVHQLFTSEDADPGAMARIGPQRERFSPPRASDRCRFGEGTFASTHGNGQDAPIAAVRGAGLELRCYPLKGRLWPRAGSSSCGRNGHPQPTADRPTAGSHVNSSSSLLASFRSAVSKPSVNAP